MLQIALCDDSKIFIESFEEKVRTYFESSNIEVTIDCYEDGYFLLKTDKVYDLIFLDVKMPIVDGFSTAKALRGRDVESLIIFITSHSQLFFNAFEVAAFRYIIKQSKSKMFEDALDAALKELEKRRGEYIAVEISAKQSIQIMIKEIMYIESNGRCTIFHLKNEIVSSILSMKTLESRLSAYSFFRSHKSFIVNLRHVKKQEKQDLVLQNGEKIVITRLKNKAFHQAFMRHLSAITSNGFITFSTEYTN